MTFTVYKLKKNNNQDFQGTKDGMQAVTRELVYNSML